MTAASNPALNDPTAAAFTECQRRVLAFYADPANWREGCGTGPNRPAPCVADGGQRAREVLGEVGVRVAEEGMR